MILQIVGLFICSMCCLSIADLGPISREAFLSTGFPTDASKNVVIGNAIVDVNLRKVSAPEQKDYINAEVDCDFTMSRLKGPQSTYEMAFPYAMDNARDPAERFVVTIEGDTIKDLTPERRWSLKNLPGTSFYAYSWAARGFTKTQRIKVSYVLGIPLCDDSAEFRYVLRTGALWAGPIKREIVTIHAPGLQVFPVKEMKQLPKSTQDGSLVWELYNARPTEDIIVKITEKGPQR